MLVSFDIYTSITFTRFQWDFEKWKYEEYTQVLVYSTNTNLPVRIKQDGSIDANGDYVDTFGTYDVTLAIDLKTNNKLVKIFVVSLCSTILV